MKFLYFCKIFVTLKATFVHLYFCTLMDTFSLIPTSVPWLVTAIILMVCSAAAMFLPRIPSCIIAYLALWAARLSGYTPFSTETMIFWGIAVVLVTVNSFMLPAFIRNSSRGLGYIATGALAGMAVGLTLYRPATVICGAVIGTFVAAIAYTRTANGAVLEFPTSKFFNYLGAKGIPAVMTASMIGLVLAGLIIRNN